MCVFVCMCVYMCVCVCVFVCVCMCVCVCVYIETENKHKFVCNDVWYFGSKFTSLSFSPPPPQFSREEWRKFSFVVVLCLCLSAVVCC